METSNIQESLLSNKNGKRLPPPPLIYQNQLPEKEPDELNLRQLLTVIRRRALVIGGVAIAVTSAISFWTFSQTPKYEGRFQLLVEPVTAEGNLDKLTQKLGENSVPTSTLDYPTQIQVLRSPNLMSPILEEIKKHYSDVEYDSLISGNQLTINRLEETKILEVRYRDTDPKKNSKSLTRGSQRLSPVLAPRATN